MIVLSLLFLCLATSALAQQVVYDTIHNVTALPGTWSSGSGNVLTGSVSLPGRPLSIPSLHTGLRSTQQPVVHLPTHNRHVLFLVSPFVLTSFHV